jgi:hypothetical protein
MDGFFLEKINFKRVISTFVKVQNSKYGDMNGYSKKNMRLMKLIVGMVKQ